MSFEPADRLGPYEIVSTLGSGGMGEVYKARDTRLDRLVAIKLATGTFIDRVEREARAIAALNHPNVCQIYDVGPDYLVMELVEGCPVRPVRDEKTLLDLALQMAEALTAAHAAGVIHRDLKPSNILVTANRQIKILDFGLATVHAAGSELAGTLAVTAAGTTLGTAAYMSPEQASGDPVDARTDLWSLGVVLYEMASGVRPFDGNTAALVFEALLTRNPTPVRERNPRISAELERVIGRLLEKDREMRYQSAADVRADLLRIRRELSAPPVPAAAAHGARGSAPPARTRRRRAAYAASAAGVLIALGAAAYLNSPAPSTISSPSTYVQLTNFSDSAAAPAVSPDGRMVAFIRGGEWFLSTAQIYVKLLPNGESVRLTNDPRPKLGPVFTPDGSRIAYTVVDRSRGTSWDTWTSPVLGGEPTRLLPNASGLVWLDERHVLYSEIKGTGLHMGIVTATDRRQEHRELYFPAHERAMAHYSWPSPDRRWVLLVEMDRTQAWQPCRLIPFDGSSAGRLVGPRGACTSAAWSPDGRWMYFSATVNRNAQLWRQRFPDGQPEQITFGPTEARGVAMGPDGRWLVTSLGLRQSSIWLHDGTNGVPVESEGYAYAPQLSADGARLYYLLQRNPTSSQNELRVLHLGSGANESIVDDTLITDFDVSSDQRELVFSARRPDAEPEIWLAPLDRRAPPRRIAREADQVSFGADGDLLFRSLEGEANYLARIAKDGSERMRLLDGPILLKFGVSPDGAWVVAGVPGTGDHGALETVAIPTAGGAPRRVCFDHCRVVWSSDGRFLYLGVVGVDEGATIVLPIPAGSSMPDIPAAGLSASLAQTPAVIEVAGVQIIDRREVAPGPNPSTYAFVETQFQSNLFQIPLD